MPIITHSHTPVPPARVAPGALRVLINFYYTNRYSLLALFGVHNVMSELSMTTRLWHTGVMALRDQSVQGMFQVLVLVLVSLYL